MFNLITILGPTATGKTRLAALLAHTIKGEIISADSRQVYRGMDIGTGKDLEDYVVEGNNIPYHLVDITDPGYEYNLFEYQRDFAEAYNKIISLKKTPILCGGTGLYLDAVVRNYNLLDVPEDLSLRVLVEHETLDEIVNRLKQLGSLHNTTDIYNRRRAVRALEIAKYKIKYPANKASMPKINSINFGIDFERSAIRQRITQRLKNRLDLGMIKEVEDLLSSGLTPEQLTFYGLEYKFVTQFVIGELTFDELFQKLNTAIHQFAKRQSTWYRRMEKRGVIIHWIDGNLSLEEKRNRILEILDDEAPGLLNA